MSKKTKKNNIKKDKESVLDWLKVHLINRKICGRISKRYQEAYQETER